MTNQYTGTPYDPRNPDPRFVLMNTSCQHSDFRQCWILLSITTQAGKVYFIIPNTSFFPSTYEELQKSRRYFIEEHSCPTNWLGGVALVSFQGDHDPHGLIAFEEAVWMTMENPDDEYFVEIFPQLTPGGSDAA